MKKVLVTVFIFLLMVSFTNLQAQPKIGFGVRAGLNLANFSFDPDIQSGLTKSSRTGFKLGALAEFGFIPMLALQVEPMYVTGGTVVDKVYFQDIGVTGKVTFKLSYLEVPILLKLRIPTPGSITPYVFAGPNIGFVFSSKQLVEAAGQSQEYDIKDETSSTNFAFDFGAGAGFKVAPMTVIMLDVRYSLGFSNLLNDKGKQEFGSNQKIKTTGIQIIAGVMFGL